MRHKISPEQIDQLLPQTQCGLCTHGGCMPYAEAIVFEQAPLNLCPPGGVATMQQLGELLQEDVSAHVEAMQQKAKPALVAVVREAECIGCTKCIQACPVDAIVGAAKLMHTVVADECTGCELCVAPCPVDCIDLIASDTILADKPQQYRMRFNERNKRLAQAEKESKIAALNLSQDKKQDYIQAALQRVKNKNIA